MSTKPLIPDQWRPKSPDLAFGTPTNSAPGDVAQRGQSMAVAAADHVHGREGSASAAAVGVRVYRSTNQVLTGGAWGQISWSVASDDPQAFWSAGNPTQLLVPAGCGGLYIAVLQVAFSASASGQRQVSIAKNPGGINWATVPRANLSAYNEAVVAVGTGRLAAGETITGYVYTDVAGINALGGSESTHLSLYRLGT